MTPAEAEYLAGIRLVEQCSECGRYHHLEYERWEEIADALQTFAEIKQAYSDKD